MGRMWKLVLLNYLLLGIYVAFAQDPGGVAAVTGTSGVVHPVPLPAPSLPESGKGWVDLLFKMLPYAWGIVSPLVVGLITTWTPKLAKKLPAAAVPVISGVIGTIGGAITGGLDALALDGGGVSPDTGALQGGATGVAAGVIAQKEPVVEKKENPSMDKEF